MTSGPVSKSASAASAENRAQARASGEWRRLCDAYRAADDVERLRMLKKMDGERLQLFDLAWRGLTGTPIPVPQRPARRGLLARVWSLLT